MFSSDQGAVISIALCSDSSSRRAVGEKGNDKVFSGVGTPWAFLPCSSFPVVSSNPEIHVSEVGCVFAVEISSVSVCSVG